jgi:hypothetical protein
MGRCDFGYVYALQNPSLPGLVKVGRTAGEPAERAAELSRATGVPTSFVVAFKRYFRDCAAAEAFVHALLERRASRVSANREFFNAQLEEVVEAILQAPGAVERGTSMPGSSTPNSEPAEGEACSDGVSLERPLQAPPWQVVLDEADAHRYGRGDCIEDPVEALRLYKLAAKLGSAQALRNLGDMCWHGVGCPKDDAQALEYFKEGARQGDTCCYAQMASYYQLERRHPGNAAKCWVRFFAAPEPTSDWLHEAYNYLADCLEDHAALEHLDAIKTVLPELTTRVARLAEYRRRKAPEHPGDETWERIMCRDALVQEFLARLAG